VSKLTELPSSWTFFLPPGKGICLVFHLQRDITGQTGFFPYRTFEHFPSSLSLEWLAFFSVTLAFATPALRCEPPKSAEPQSRAFGLF